VLTLDEADRMLDMGFLPALRRIAAVVPRRRQTLLFSATLSEDITRLSSEFTRDPVRVDVSARQVVAATVTHQVHEVHVDRKRDVLTRILTQHGAARRWCSAGPSAAPTASARIWDSAACARRHPRQQESGCAQPALDDFKAGRVRVLVATDIAARGLDIAHLPLVVNFDLPLVAEDYVHRVGRTGRAGETGRAVSLVSASESGLLRQIQQVVAAPLERVALPIPNATENIPGDREQASPDARGSWVPVARQLRTGNRDRQFGAGRRHGGAHRAGSGGRVVSRVNRPGAGVPVLNTTCRSERASRTSTAQGTACPTAAAVGLPVLLGRR
jgi:ATP-dependent RNA helicase RhlE